jgi:hypothetical protein
MKSPSRQKNVPTKYLSTRTDLSPAAEEKRKKVFNMVKYPKNTQIRSVCYRTSSRTDPTRPSHSKQKEEKGKVTP